MSFTELQKRTKKTLAGGHQFQKIKKHLAHLEERLVAAYVVQNKLGKVLEEEYEEEEESCQKAIRKLGHQRIKLLIS